MYMLAEFLIKAVRFALFKINDSLLAEHELLEKGVISTRDNSVGDSMNNITSANIKQRWAQNESP